MERKYGPEQKNFNRAVVNSVFDHDIEALSLYILSKQAQSLNSKKYISLILNQIRDPSKSKCFAIFIWIHQVQRDDRWRLRDAVRILFSRVCSCELKSVLMVKLRKTTCSYFMCKIVISGYRICMSLLYQNMWFEWINWTYSNLVLTGTHIRSWHWSACLFIFIFFLNFFLLQFLVI